MKTRIAAIEFGTSKIATVIAKSDGRGRCDIVSCGRVNYDGYRDGDWVNPEALEKAVFGSVLAAQSEAGTKIKEIYIGVPCEFIHVKQSTATVTVKGEDGKVSDDDINAVQDAAGAVFEFEKHGGNVIHRSPAWFSIDNGPHTMKPLNATAEQLSACVSFIVAEQYFIDDMIEIMGKAGITINGFLSPTFGEQLMLISEEDRERPCIFVNSGLLNTELSVIEGDGIVYHAVLPKGGSYITDMLSEQLEISEHDAETLKRSVVLKKDEAELLENPTFRDANGRSISFDEDTVCEIIQQAVDDIVEDIRLTIEDAGSLVMPRSKLYLTGGGLALIRGAGDYIKEGLKRQVKLPTIRSSRLGDPCYSSVMGLVDLIYDSIEQRTQDDDILPVRVVDGIKSIFNKRSN